jgi:hypothetical protein
VDRGGEGKLLEVYPAGALLRWGLPARGYKGEEGQPARRQLVGHLIEAAPWLAAHRAALAESDHALDALLAALVARAAAEALTDPAPPEHAERARREGWIHLPKRDSLRLLLRPQG